MTKQQVKDQAFIIIANWFVHLKQGQIYAYVGIVVLIASNFLICPDPKKCDTWWHIMPAAADRLSWYMVVLIVVGTVRGIWRAWEEDRDKWHNINAELADAQARIKTISERKSVRNHQRRPPSQSQKDFAAKINRWMSLDEIGELPFPQDDEYLTTAARRRSLLKRYKIRRAMCGVDEGIVVQSGNMYIGRGYFNPDDDEFDPNAEATLQGCSLEGE